MSITWLIILEPDTFDLSNYVMNNLAVLLVHESRSCVEDIHARVWKSRAIIGQGKKSSVWGFVWANLEDKTHTNIASSF